MAMKHLKTPETTVYRKVGNELVVIQLDTAHFYYFSPETENVLEYFKSPATLDQLIGEAGANEKEHLLEFCHLLLEKQILKETKPDKKAAPKMSSPYKRPVYLREGEKTLEQISFASP
jgi:hypothetical protein